MRLLIIFIFAFTFIGCKSTQDHYVNTICINYTTGDWSGYYLIGVDSASVSEVYRKDVSNKVFQYFTKLIIKEKYMSKISDFMIGNCRSTLPENIQNEDMVFIYLKGNEYSNKCLISGKEDINNYFQRLLEIEKIDGGIEIVKFRKMIDSLRSISNR